MASRGERPSGEASTEKLAGFLKSRKAIYSGVGLAVILAVGGGALYFVLQPPDATPSTLLAAAKVGYGPAVTDPLKRQLCLTNFDYSQSTLNAAETDQRTQTWMNTLVTAGLYSPPNTINTGGYFPRNLLQYAATPELEKYRDDSRLCLSKDIEIVNVVDIEDPIEVPSQRADGIPKILIMKAKLVLQSVTTAPWMKTPEVRAAVLPNLNGWEYQDGRLEKKIANSFVLIDRKWVTGTVSQSQLKQQSLAAQRRQSEQVDEQSSHSSANQGLFAGISSALSDLFSFGGHPLKGTWRVDTDSMSNSLGMGLPKGLGLDMQMTFTSTSMELGGASTKCQFEVAGNRVTVKPEGQAASVTFVMLDHDTAMVDLGLLELKYKRVN